MPTRAKHQPECEECGAPAGIDWKDDPRDSSTWCYTECRLCGSHLCPDCGAEGECITCLCAERESVSQAIESLESRS